MVGARIMYGNIANNKLKDKAILYNYRSMDYQ